MTGGIHLIYDSFTLDEGPITPLQLAKVCHWVSCSANVLCLCLMDSQTLNRSAYVVIQELKKKTQTAVAGASAGSVAAQAAVHE